MALFFDTSNLSSQKRIVLEAANSLILWILILLFFFCGFLGYAIFTIGLNGSALFWTFTYFGLFTVFLILLLHFLPNALLPAAFRNYPAQNGHDPIVKKNVDK